MRTAVAAACFLFCGLAVAQGASAPPAGASAPVNIVGTYTIHPGQSLHDAAVDLTQSHDKTVLARMASALFDANPQAFNRHDPSLLRANSVLNVPQVPDLSSAASGVTPAAAPTAAPASASMPAASPAAAASNAAAQAVSAASSAAAAATAGASSANAAASATAAASEPATAASAPAAAESAPGTAAGASTAASGSSASDSHVYSGAIQASAPAMAASGANASGPVHASSLQQLLALKNRVLMALQGHGAGQAAQSSASGAPAAQGGASAQTAANANAAAVDTQVSPTTWGIVVAVLVALVALIAGLIMRKRKKPPVEIAANEPAPAPHEPALAAAVAEHEVAARDEAEAPPVAEVAPDVREPVAPEHSFAPEVAHETAIAHEAEDVAEARAEEEAVPHRDETLGHATEAASLEAAASLGADALPPTFAEPQHAPEDAQAEPPAHDAHEDRATHIEPTLTDAHYEPETRHDATEAASLAAAAELGAEALPPESVSHEAELPKLEAEPAPLAPAPAGAAPDLALDFGDDLGHTPRPASAQHAESQPQPHAEPEALHEPQAETEALPQHAEPEALPQPPASLVDSALPAAPAVPEEDMNYLDVPTEFPRDAVEALGDIGLPLPPRIGEPILPAGPLSSEPVATPEATGQFDSPFHVPPAPLVGETIEQGLAGAGALAGLGAPRFGALTLDFDLDLPPDSAEPLPVFTPEQLTRIARNKLDLAQEYISLGDVSGARSLINEVIESNDHATRSDAQALLSTLAPLS